MTKGFIEPIHKPFGQPSKYAGANDFGNDYKRSLIHEFKIAQISATGVEHV